MRVPLVLVAVLAVATPGLADHNLVHATAERLSGPHWIQPGAPLDGICTLNFVFDGLGPKAGRVYVGTAGHCVDRVGQRTSSGDFDDFGVVVLDDDGPLDVALIEVLPAFRAGVNAEVLGHPGMPTGSTTLATTRIGDAVLFSGYGTGFGATFATRESRAGVLAYDDEQTYHLYGPIVFGDSGGPILHQPTGAAFGLVNHLAVLTVEGGCAGACDGGTTVQGFLARAAAYGFPLALRTAS